MRTDEILLTTSEAGRRFKPPLTSERIRQLCDAGALQALRTPGGVRLIPQGEIDRLVEQRRQQAQNEPEGVVDFRLGKYEGK